MSSASKSEATAPQKLRPPPDLLAPASLTDMLSSSAVKHTAPFTMYHSVESANGYWYAVRTVVDATGRVVSRDVSHELQRGAATEVCRLDMDRVACDMWHKRYGIEGQAEILRKDAINLRKLGREASDKCAPIEKKIRDLTNAIDVAEGNVKSRPSLADVQGKVLLDGKLIDASEVPKHRSWQATAPQTREADEQRIPTIIAQIEAEDAKLEQLLVTARECDRQADILSKQATEKAALAREAGDKVILRQKGRKLI